MANFMMGTPSRFERIQKFDPQRMGGLDQLLQQGLAGLQQGPADFAPIEAQARKSFFEDTAPTLAERFTSPGAKDSSAFKEVMQRGSQGLETSLAALKSQHGLGQQQQLLQMLNLGLQPQQEIGYFGGREGALGGILGGFGQGLGAVMPALGKMLLQGSIGAATGGPAGAAVGAGTAAIEPLLKMLSYMMANKDGGGQDTGSVTFEQPVT